MKKRIIVTALIAIAIIALCAGIAIFIVNTVTKDSQNSTKTNMNPSSQQTTHTAPENAPNAEIPAPVVEEAVQTAPKQVTSAPKVEEVKPQPAVQCPSGSYRIGGTDQQPVCKNEPTGCPYGDSIPLDSPKCAPSAEEKAKQ